MILRVFVPSPPGIDLDAVTDAAMLFDICVSNLTDDAELMIEQQPMTMAEGCK